ncbi:hypothetical protein DMC30DRAFT_400181 [Rhodotorula diobovata]|uniref:Uncharacterized protein n=1 Tax=Rhodotorula diobovata TaxID=5288 RepID=A0A5C5FU48_9BASI|nr:hypothetical protein DMC30DRAFT_400181 [Rhodotorula diobovata]
MRSASCVSRARRSSASASRCGCAGCGAPDEAVFSGAAGESSARFSRAGECRRRRRASSASARASDARVVSSSPERASREAVTLSRSSSRMPCAARGHPIAEGVNCRRQSSPRRGDARRAATAWSAAWLRRARRTPSARASPPPFLPLDF